MASRKITELTALTTPASGDVLPIIDISEPLPENQNKKITYAELLASAPNGTDAAPAVAFEGDPDTGLFSADANALGFASGGAIRLRVDNDGLKFGSATAAANALNAYEEGTFTPVLIGLTTSGTGTYSANGQVGRYTRIGNRVLFDVYLSWTAHTGTGNMEITGLPFTVQNTTNGNRTYSAIFSAITLTAGNIGAAFSSPGTSVIALRQLPTGGGAVASVPMDTSGAVTISGHFEV